MSVRSHLPRIELKHLLPPTPALFVEEIYPDTASSPAPTFEVVTIRLLHEEIHVDCVRIDAKRFGLLDVRVDDGDHLNARQSL